jgi:SAM-dependent methyltransferase
MGNKKSTQYDPATYLDWNFERRLIHFRKKTGKPVMEDPDLLVISKFLQKNAKSGDFLNIGAGVTHFHYLSILENKIKKATAIELSKINIGALYDFYRAVSPGKKKKHRGRITSRDINVLIAFAEWANRNHLPYITGHQVLQSVFRKTFDSGTLRSYQGNMHTIVPTIKKKFDTVLMLFAMYAKSERQIVTLMRRIRRIMCKKGKLIIVDLHNFTVDNTDEKLIEDPIVQKEHPQYVNPSLAELIQILKTAGFKPDQIIGRESKIKFRSHERLRGYVYHLIAATK